MSCVHVTWCGPRHVALTTFDLSPARKKTEQDRPEPSPLLVADLDRERVVWQYQPGLGQGIDHMPDDRHWYLAAPQVTRPARLAALALPDKEAEAAIAAAPPVKPLVSPGDPVSLSVDLGLAADHEKSEEVRAGLQKRFEELMAHNKWTASTKAPRVFKVLLKERIGEEEMRLLLLRGRGHRVTIGPTMLIHPLEVRCEVSLTDDAGKTLWTLARTFSAEHSERFIPLDRPERKLPESFRVQPWINAIGWAMDVQLPGKIYPPSYYEGIGESKLTPTGATRVRLLAQAPGK
jgi:hypothetical protein